MLDRYIHGYANNLNSRAPVPVLKETHRYEDVGAAGQGAPVFAFREPFREPSRLCYPRRLERITEAEHSAGLLERFVDGLGGLPPPTLPSDHGA